MAGNLAPKNQDSPVRSPYGTNVPLVKDRALGQRKIGRLRAITTPRKLLTAGVTLGIILTAVYGADQLSNMPRERAQRGYNYFERVWHGLQMVSRIAMLHVMAEADPYPTTSLPVIKLEVGDSILDALNANLPESGTKRQPGAQITLGDATYPAEVRYSGISVNHWGMPWKSWGVKISGGAFNGMPNFTLMIPRADTQFENWLGNEMARRLGNILTPDSEFIHFRLNGKLNGVRLLTEPVGPGFLARRSLPPGKIFNGDISTAQIYSGVPRERLFSQKEGWEIDSPFPNDPSGDEITKLIDVVQRIRNPYEFYFNLPEVMEVDSLVRYMALLEMVSSVHIDETHNWKLYLNPETKRFAPIIWNSVAYYWKNTKSIDLAPNDLFRVVLSNPGLREKKDRYLWDAMQGVLSEAVLQNLVTSEVARIKPDMHASALKWEAGDRGIRLLTNAEWDESIRSMLQVIDERHGYLRSQLAPTEARYRLVTNSGRTQIGMKIASRSGVLLETLALSLQPPRAGLRVTLTRRGLGDMKTPVMAEREKIVAVSGKDGVVHLTVNDTLTSKRRIQKNRAVEVVPATYVYEVSAPPGTSIGSVVNMEAKNSVTKEAYSPTEDGALLIPEKHVPNIVWWEPSEFLPQVKSK